MEPNFEKKKFKVAVVNTDDMARAQARDIGDARMTESKEDRSGSRFEKFTRRIWKHNLFQEYYRQKEISKAKSEILETGNLYAGEQEFNPDGNISKKHHEEAMGAIVERFISEYEDEEVLKEGESRHSSENEQLNSKIKDLIKHYAGSEMTQASFEEEKKRILSFYDKKIASGKSLYTDNIFSIASEVKDSVIHGAKINELDFEVEVILGKAREALSTEAHQTNFDNCVEKLQNSKIGRFIANEPAVLAVTAGLWEVGRNVLQKGLSKGASWATLGGGAVIAGGISAMKERARVTRERSQHQRESAKGMVFKEEDMKRRQEMEKYSYDTKSETIILENLNSDLERLNKGNLSQEEIDQIMGRLADLESRISLNNEEKIDLITYDKFDKVEKDHTSILLKRAELKVALKKNASTDDFNTKLNELTQEQKHLMFTAEQGIDEKDEKFAEFRNRRALKAFIKTTLIGGALGAAFHGARTLFEGISDDSNMLSNSGSNIEDVGGTHISLPNGVTLEENPDGTFNLVKGDEVLSKNIPIYLDDNGNLSKETQEALAKSGISSEFVLCGDKTTKTIHESAEDYVKNRGEGMQDVKRELWYDNDTPHPFDKNELKLDWGGEKGTGIDENGNYVLNIDRMAEGGSFHGSESVDAKEALASGKIKMLFSLSRDTQGRVFEVPIDADGNVKIDPDSEIGKLMFSNVDGKAVFTGQFAEVAQSIGNDENGAENVRILATHVGEGKTFIDGTETVDTTEPFVTINIPKEETGEFIPFIPFIPLSGRRPLERGVYRTDKEVKAGRTRIEKNDKVASENEESKTETEKSKKPKTKKTNSRSKEAKTNTRPNEEKEDINNPEEGIPVFITNKLRADLKKFGISDEEIDKMKPKEAWEILKNKNLEKEQTSKDNVIISSKTKHVYGFNKLDEKYIKEKLKNVKSHENSEVLIFEISKNDRKENIKNIKSLKKRHPKVKFTYITLPVSIIKIKEKYIGEYAESRYQDILSNSKLDKEPQKEFFLEGEKKPSPIAGVAEESKQNGAEKIDDTPIEIEKEKVKPVEENITFDLNKKIQDATNRINEFIDKRVDEELKKSKSEKD